MALEIVTNLPETANPMKLQRCKRMAHALVGAAITASSMPALTASSAFAQAKRQMCWSPDQLRHGGREHVIRKNISKAFVPRPVGRLRPPPRRLKALGPRNIRRVDLPAGVRKIAFTFDLCEQPYEISGYQGGIVDYLRRHNIPATFFAGGKWMMTHPRRAQQIIGDRCSRSAIMPGSTETSVSSRALTLTPN